MFTSEGAPRARRPVIVAIVAALSMTTIPAAADDQDDPPDFSQPHPHALLVHAETVMNPAFDPADPTTGPPLFPAGYERCIDLANGRALPSNNHHGTVHTGRAGRALVGAGHLIVPAPCGPGLDAYIEDVRERFGLDD